MHNNLVVAGVRSTCQLYLCAIKDVFTNRMVGYSIDSRMNAGIAVTL